MKKNRIIIAVALLVFVGCGWISQISNSIKNEEQYYAYIEVAEEYFEDGLYQKSIQAYRDAIAIKMDVNIYEKLVRAYEKSYMEGTSTLMDYSSALMELCELNTSESENWEKLIQLYVDNGDYKSAYSVVKKCSLGDEASKSLNLLIRDVTYSYTISKKTYTEFYRSPEGYYSVNDGKYWGIMDSNGEWLYECEYSYAGPVNEDVDVFLAAGNGKRIIDASGITQALVSEDVVATNMYSQGFLPIKCEDNRWRYYSCEKKKFIWNDYDYASGFEGDRALVYVNGSWMFINNNGDMLEDEKYEDVKMLGNGQFSYSGIMIASQDDSYYIFDSSGSKLCDTAFEKLDVYLGESIAYLDANGKWGFVDSKGNRVINAQYDSAKSFSNGFAAVQKEGKWGAINEKGEVIIDYQFADMDYFTNQGVCMVSTFEGLYYPIDLRFY